MPSQAAATATPPAYFRLVGFHGGPEGEASFESDVSALPAILGRSGDNRAIVLNESDTTISRNHAMISWNRRHRVYSLTCLSKNGLVCDRVRVAKDQTLTLRSGSSLKIGKTKLYFTLPQEALMASGELQEL